MELQATLDSVRMALEEKEKEIAALKEEAALERQRAEEAKNAAIAEGAEEQQRIADEARSNATAAVERE